MNREGAKRRAFICGLDMASSLERMAVRSQRLCGTGAAGDTLVVTWAVGTDTLQALLRQAEAGMARVL